MENNDQPDSPPGRYFILKDAMIEAMWQEKFHSCNIEDEFLPDLKKKHGQDTIWYKLAKSCGLTKEDEIKKKGNTFYTKYRKIKDEVRDALNAKIAEKLALAQQLDVQQQLLPIGPQQNEPEPQQEHHEESSQVSQSLPILDLDVNDFPLPDIDCQSAISNLENIRPILEDSCHDFQSDVVILDEIALQAVPAALNHCIDATIPIDTWNQSFVLTSCLNNTLTVDQDLEVCDNCVFILREPPVKELCQKIFNTGCDYKTERNFSIKLEAISGSSRIYTIVLTCRLDRSCHKVAINAQVEANCEEVTMAISSSKDLEHKCTATKLPVISNNHSHLVSDGEVTLQSNPNLILDPSNSCNTTQLPLNSGDDVSQSLLNPLGITCQKSFPDCITTQPSGAIPAGEVMQSLINSSSTTEITSYVTTQSSDQDVSDDEVPSQNYKKESLVMNRDIWDKIITRQCDKPQCGGCEVCRFSFNRNWTNEFNSLIKSPYPNCVWAFKRYKFNAQCGQGPAMMAYGKCKHSSCYGLKCRIETLPEKNSAGVNIDFYVIGNYHHESGEKHRRDVSGSQRSGLTDTLAHRKPNQIRLEKLYNVSENILQAGNYNDAPSLATLQKIRSDAICKARLSSDPFEDCKLSCKGKNPCGIEICSFLPFKLYWRLPQHLQAIPSAREAIVMYLDCTGSMCMDIFGKPTFYYCGVIQPKKGSGKVFPILEFLSDSHYSNTIRDFLGTFKMACAPGPRVKTPFPKVLVIDYSWGFLHASVFTFTGKDIVDYLDICYKVFCDETKTMPLTIIHLCGAHEAHAVSTWIGKQRVPKATAHLARRCFRAILKSGSLDEAKTIVNLMGQVFSSKFKSSETDTALTALKNLLDDKLLPNQELVDVDAPVSVDNRPNDDKDPDNKKLTLYESSPFYHFFKSDLQSEDPIEEEDSERNEYYFPSYMPFLLKHHLPYYPLISKKLVKDHVDPKSGLLTNNSVEGWIGTTKEHTLDGQLRLTPGDLMRKLCQNVRERAKDLLFDTEYRKKQVSINVSEISSPRSQSIEARKDMHGTPAPVRYPVNKRKAQDPLSSKENWSRGPQKDVTFYVPGQNCVKRRRLSFDDGELCPSDVIEEVVVTSNSLVPSSVALIDHGYSFFKTLETESSQPSQKRSPSQPEASDELQEKDSHAHKSLSLEVERDSSVMVPETQQNDAIAAPKSPSIEVPLPQENHIELTEDDMRSLSGWFSDNIIDAFFNLQSAKALDLYSVSINCCPIKVGSFLAFENDTDILSVYNYCKNSSAFNADIWMWPIIDHSRAHYILVLVVIKLKMIIFLDPKSSSIGDPFQRKILRGLFRLIYGLFHDTYSADLDASTWRNIVPSDLPQQVNEDCGPFICAWARLICTGDNWLSVLMSNSNGVKKAREMIKQELISTTASYHLPPDTLWPLPMAPGQESYPLTSRQVPQCNVSTIEFLANLSCTLFKATPTTCAHTPCQKPKTKMFYCVGYHCHDWYHILCVETFAKDKRGPKKADYFCPKCRQMIRDGHSKSAREHTSRMRK